MESSAYALVLTGEVLPGYAPETVWPALAAYFRMEPAKLTGQLLARAPLTIKESEDLGKLQTLQGAAATIGAATDLCAPDGRANLFVVLDNAPRGPVPRVFVDERVEHGLWPDSVLVAAVGTSSWLPYRGFDADAVAATTPPAAEPIVEQPAHNVTDVTTEPLRLLPLASADGGEGALPLLPPGAAINAGFWRRCAALIIDSILLGIAAGLVEAAFGAGMLGTLTSGNPNLGAVAGTMFGMFTLTFVGQWLYFALFESSRAQATPGKMALHIKVVDLTGARIGFARASGRYFAKIISSLIFAIGYMMAGWTERKQALHDMMASTLVVFGGVQPGQDLPTVRPQMPWYGWLLNVLVIGGGVLAFAAFYWLASSISQHGLF